MKTIKILLILAVLVGCVIGGYMLMVPTPDVGDRRHRQGRHVHVEVEVIPDVGGEEGAVIRDYVAQFSGGWDETLYSNAQSYIGHPDRLSSTEQMQDQLVSGIMNKLDSIVRGVYRSNPAQGPSAGHPVLGPSYAGLERIGADFPVALQRGIYARLMDDREIYDGIHAFAVQTFRVSPRFNLRLVRSASGYSLDWNEQLENYAVLRSRMETRRRNLEDRLARCEDLASVAWLRPALAEQRFLDRITTAETTYKNAERGQFLATLRSLPSDPRLCNDAAAACAVAEQLTALEANLPSLLFSDEASRAFASVKARLNEVTAGPVTR